MRELALWDGSGETVFSDIADRSRRGVAFAIADTAPSRTARVRAAVEDGLLDPGRLAGHRKLLKEDAWLVRREDAGARPGREGAMEERSAREAKRRAVSKREPR